jgi:hypothetical protein
LRGKVARRGLEDLRCALGRSRGTSRNHDN